MAKLVDHGSIGNGQSLKTFNLLSDAVLSKYAGKQNPRDGSRAYEASSTARAAIRLRQNAVSQAPLSLFDANDNKIESHKLLDLLAEVNDEENWSDLIKNTEADLQVYPYALWAKGRESVTGRGKVLKLFRLNPAFVQLQPVRRDGDVTFTIRYQPPNGQAQTYERLDIVYFKGQYNPKDDVVGLSPLAQETGACVAERDVSQYLNSFFENGAVPGLVFTSEEPVSDTDIERLKKQVDGVVGGVRKFFKTLFLGNMKNPPVVMGYDIKSLDLSVVEAGLVKKICKTLGVPELLVNQTNAADLTPLKLAQTLMWTSTIIPQLKWYAEVLNAQLLTEFPDLVRSGAYLAFEYDETLEDIEFDQAAYQESVRKDFEAGLISDKAARRELGYTEDDAPEEPPQPTVAPTVAPTGPQEAPQAPVDAQADPVKADLARWQRKALKAVKAGKGGAVTFESDAIPAALQAQINADLAAAQDADAVKAAFAQVDVSEAERLTAALTRLALELKGLEGDHGGE